MSQKEEHEKYLLKVILSDSLSSDNPSKKAFKEGYSNSLSYFNGIKNNLLDKYENKSLTDFPGSKMVQLDSGEILQIKQSQKFNFDIRDNDYKNSLKSNLKLLYNVGPATEKKLKNQGFNNLEDLTNHKRYGENACNLLEKIDNYEFLDLIHLVKQNRYSNQCKKNVLKSLSLVDAENLKFMDIETLGLSNVPIILIGVAEIKGNNITSTQYLLPDITNELALLEAYLTHLNEDSVHVTFNGKFFDVPFIKNRLNYYDMENQILNLPNYDLYQYSKYMWGDKLPNCKLQTIEKYIFGLERVGDVPGQYVPDFYKSYLEQDNVGPLVPIVEHNKQDVISLADFIMKMYEEVNRE